jgi:hypothetical protein
MQIKERRYAMNIINALDASRRVSLPHLQLWLTVLCLPMLLFGDSMRLRVRFRFSACHPEVDRRDHILAPLIFKCIYNL